MSDTNLEELLERLPKTLELYGLSYGLTIAITARGEWVVFYSCLYKPKQSDFDFRSTSLHHALAEMYAYLQENGLIQTKVL